MRRSALCVSIVEGEWCWNKRQGREVVIEALTVGDESRGPPHFRIGEGEWCWSERRENKVVIEDGTGGNEQRGPPHFSIRRGNGF